jgi:SAM-dependent methyltransferase
MAWKDGVAPAGYAGKGKIESLLGRDIWKEFEGKTVIDFGCGSGSEALEIVRRCPTAQVIGLEIQESRIREAYRRARVDGVDTSRVTFTSKAPRCKADVVLSLDSFEHFSNPGQILRDMDELLNDNGRILISFGPPWYHPKGSHFPGLWSNLLFTEKSLLEWRSNHKNDGARQFGDVAGGLNRMTIRKFEECIEGSPFEFESLRLVPIRVARLLHNRLTREFLTATVRATLRRRVCQSEAAEVVSRAPRVAAAFGSAQTSA